MKRPASSCIYELYLTRNHIPATAWQNLFSSLARLSTIGTHWQIFTAKKHAKLHFYLETSLLLPASLDSLPDFLFQKLEQRITPPVPQRLRFCSTLPTTSFIALQNYLSVKKHQQLTSLQISFQKLYSTRYIAKIYAHTTQSHTYILPASSPAQLLSIDFGSSRDLLYKSAPKYLDAQKILPFLSPAEASALLEIETFPYQTSPFLPLKNLDFAKHSLVLGASGSGKSKFLSLFIEKLALSHDTSEKYKLVAIDPHAALENDVGAYAKVINFLTDTGSIKLFDDNARDPVVATELMLELLKSLLADNYNSKVARVLRHSVSILLSLGQFNFHNLHELLLNLEYRNQILQNRTALPTSSLEFFLTEYNEIKTRSYTEAISPIIALIDEVEMIPVLGKDLDAPSLQATISENFLTLFSFDRTKLGDRVTATLSGIIMQQLITLVQNRTFDQHIIFVIDEVAVIENPILKRFLSEARKFNLSLILAGQYFSAISQELRTAISANTTNYYIFRVAKDDATSLIQSFDFKIPLDDTAERKVKTLTELQNRECVARISCNDQLLPAIKGRTLDFVPKPQQSAPATASPESAPAPTLCAYSFTTKSAPKFQVFLGSSQHSPRRPKRQPYEDHLKDPLKIKFGDRK